MKTIRKKIIDLLDEFPVQMEWHDNADLANFLLSHGVTVQECVHKCWDVCNNNGYAQYRCPHCETVYVYIYKNHIAPDSCKECGARLYLPQQPKGE